MIDLSSVKVKNQRSNNIHKTSSVVNMSEPTESMGVSGNTSANLGLYVIKGL